MPRIAFMVSQNRAREFFWKADYQSHPNGAEAINAVYLASMSPNRDAAFIGAMFDGDVGPISGGMRVSCGPAQEVRVLSPQALMAHDPAFEAGSISPVLAGISLVSGAPRDTISASKACGMFIEWAAL
jgi:hypothetical protein